MLAPTCSLHHFRSALGRLRLESSVLLLAVTWLLGARGPLQAAETSTPPANQLTAEEKAAGWKLLFDGKTTQGWHSFGKTTFPDKGWTVEDGALHHTGNAGGGDIFSDGTYAEFELVWEWHMVAGGNSGLKYFVRDYHERPIGHEYQLLNPPDSEPGKGSTGGFYDVIAPLKIPALHPLPQFNQSRILVHGNHVEHWLNGEKTADYRLGSPEVLDAVAKSKFKSVPGFGTCVRGQLMLQDHGGDIHFRNVKIREFTPAK